ncbi:beta-xylanase [Aureimonas endophytica]|uniref:Beta-xylanase n=1 Tax=Aureimonas endophytica TaxID=2027858 RepID=A0A916ZHR7_9HYPH|nr:endo-1,4-beta-xylanase [Aureimonas endophytica]GGD96941.1 beta-xylanase [Aureimonas endophytica]
MTEDGEPRGRREVPAILAAKTSGGSLTRRSLLAGGTLALAGMPMAQAASPRPARRVPFGAAMQAEHLGDARYRALFRAHCDLVLPMNELKFGLVHPEPERFDFAPADAVLDLARAEGQDARGHAVIWWNEVPPWLAAVTEPGAAERALRQHVETVVGRYAGRLASWDVVNEVVAHEAPPDAPLRDTVWLRALGPRHIPLAFAAVATADPQAKLVLNDYDLEFEGDRYDRRRATVLEIVRQLQEAGLRIDAVGIQGHLYAEKRIDIPALAAFGAALRRLGIALMVTELDVIDWRIPGGAAAQDAAAARIVGDFLEGVFAAGRPAAVIAWGLTDRYSWVDDAMPHADGTPSRPLPFDADYRPKPWFDLIERRLRDG